MKKIGHLSVLLVLAAACAKQGVIPNPDRFPPHLISVTAANQTQVNLRFDEALKSSSIMPSTFTLSSSYGQAKIRFAAKDPNDAQGRSLILLTSPLAPGTYTISGLVADGKDNAASIRASFKASAKRDTLPPYLSLLPFEERTSFPYILKLESAEPVDTSIEIMTLTAPFVPAASLTESWNSDLTRLDINCGDSTLKSRAFYYVLLPGVADFAGNRTGFGVSKLMYSDTTLPLYPVMGRILTEQGKGAASSLVLFKQWGGVVAATIADTSGVFISKLAERDSLEIEAYFDRERDGIFEESYRGFFPALGDSIIITTQQVSQPLRFEQLLTR